jgi:hypothetical protein
VDKKRGRGSLAIIVMVVGAQFRAVAEERSPASGSGVNASHESAPDTISSRPRPDDEAQTATLDVLADSLGVDPSTPGLARRPKRSNNVWREWTPLEDWAKAHPAPRRRSNH